MKEVKLGVIEKRFAQIIWENAPLTTRELIKLCEEQLEWRRTTTYTVLKKLCNRGITKMENSLVTVLITREEYDTIQSERFIEKNFQGSLPAFIAAFTAGKKLSEKEAQALQAMMDAFENK